MGVCTQRGLLGFPVYHHLISFYWKPHILSFQISVVAGIWDPRTSGFQVATTIEIRILWKKRDHLWSDEHIRKVDKSCALDTWFWLWRCTEKQLCHIWSPTLNRMYRVPLTHYFLGRFPVPCSSVWKETQKKQK